MRNTDKPRLSSNTPPRPKDIDVIPEPSHPSKTSRIMVYGTVVALTIVAISIFRILTWGLDNKPTLVVNNSPFPVRTIRNHTTGAGVVFLDADYCKNKNIEGDLRVSFLAKDREIFLPIIKERAPKGCHRMEFPVVVPKDIPPEEYKIKFRAIYDKNPLKQNEIVEFESRSFPIDALTP